MANVIDFLDEEFDYKNVPVSTGVNPEPVPPGRYMLQCEKGEMTPTRSGEGILFKVMMAILTGEYAGRLIWSNFNIKNKSEQAVTIGVGELKALIASLGIDWDTFLNGDTDMILYKPFEAEVGMEKESINPINGKPFAPRNRIMKYIVKDGKTAVAKTAQKVAAKPAMRPVVDDTDDEVPF